MGAKPHARRVLIFRVGSIGDTVVALPCLRLIARSFPDADRRILSFSSDDSRAAPLRAVLDGTGLINDYFYYSKSDRTVRGLLRMGHRIRTWRPDVLIYLMEDKGLRRTFQDAAFFWGLCGIRTVYGLPFSKEPRRRWCSKAGKLAESEASYLARRIAELGDADVADPENRSIGLTEQERQTGKLALSPLLVDSPLIAAGIGAKVDTNDWGDEKWAVLLKKLSERWTGQGLAMVGAASERERTARLLRNWSGPAVNLCGRLTVRESAAVIERAGCFIGHDSGPMHIAAAVQTPCVAIFSGRNPPGEWFPLGEGHRVLYHQLPCSGCRLEVCEKNQKRCIRSITVEQVLDAVDGVLACKRETRV